MGQAQLTGARLRSRAEGAVLKVLWMRRRRQVVFSAPSTWAAGLELSKVFFILGMNECFHSFLG